MKITRNIFLGIFFSFLLSFTFSNEEVFAVTSGDWEYNVIDNTAAITNYYGEDSTVTIPSSLDGLAVTQIGYEEVTTQDEILYYNVFAENDNVKEVKIPNSVRKIISLSFANCSNLEKVEIPESVKMIGKNFAKGSNKVNYTIPGNLTLLANGQYRELVNVTTLGGTSMYNMEYEILELVNQERQKIGVEPLELDAQLIEDANLRAAEVSVFYSHTRPSGDAFYSAITNLGYYVGENIAAGYRSSQDVMNGWMESPGHRANILDPGYKTIGIGVYQINGTYYYTQNFSAEEKISEFNKEGQASVNYTFPVCTYDGKFSNLEIEDFPGTYTFGKGGEYIVSNIFMLNTGFHNFKTPITLNSLKWTSSNENIVSVDENGNITGIKGGASNITASIGEFSRFCTFMVEVPLERIEIIGKNELDISSAEDANTNYTVKYYPEDTTSPRSINWFVDNPNILTINSDGTVNVLKTGKTTITANTLSGKDARFEINVVKHITGILFEQQEINMYVDEEKNLNASVLPEDTTDDKTLSYTSYNKSVATVDNSGKIIPLKAGVTFIDVTTSNGIFKRCKVNVNKRNIEDVNISKVHPRIYAGSQIEPKISATINGKKLIEGEDYTLSYRNNDTYTDKAEIIVEGIGNYEGIRTEYFEIVDYLKGDVNEDTFINSTDAALVLDLYKYGNAASRQYETGDMNQDSILNSTDASMILDVFKNGLN